jgi:ATP-dependent DNA helicase RecG
MGKKNHTPEALMKMAIEAMHKSISEPRDDNKPSPKVGAVLHKPNGDIETGCRGELRYGDHAEFTLLERKNRGNLVEGSTLYATLEPCAPGSRNHPKLGCAERIFLARIKKVYVGIEDDDPSVAGKGIRYLKEKGIEVEMFPSELQQEIRIANKVFIDDALQRASQQEFKPVTPKPSLLEYPTPVNTSPFDSQALLALNRALNNSPQHGSYDTETLLLNLGIYTEIDGQRVPTGSGEILFGSHPRHQFQQAGLLAIVHYPNGKEETKSFDGPMVLIPPALEEWLEKVLPLSMDRNQMHREQHLDLPMEIIREAVINALVHRDYEIKEAKCQLVISPESIIIKSPGAPIEPITLEQMQSFSAPMLSRNPKLHYIFNLLGLAEERGLGLSSLKKRAEELRLPQPCFTFEAPYLTLTLYRNSEAQLSAQNLTEDLNKSQRSGWAWVSSRSTTSSSEYEKEMGVSNRTALNHLSKFESLGLVKRRGSGNTTVYEVTR